MMHRVSSFLMQLPYHYQMCILPTIILPPGLVQLIVYTRFSSLLRTMICCQSKHLNRTVCRTSMGSWVLETRSLTCRQWSRINYRLDGHVCGKYTDRSTGQKTKRGKSIVEV